MVIERLPAQLEPDEQEMRGTSQVSVERVGLEPRTRGSTGEKMYADDTVLIIVLLVLIFLAVTGHLKL
jgi:hypothetical protein